MSSFGSHVTPRTPWCEPGPDTCEFCRYGFYAEVGYYCAECDRVVCAFCVVHKIERRCVICPECSRGDAH